MSRVRNIVPVTAIAIGLLLIAGVSCAPCSCLNWNPITVTWSGSSSATWTGDCEGTLFISWVSSNTAVLINSNVNCKPGCQPSYTWSVTKVPGSGSLEGPWKGAGLPASFSPTSPGSFSVVLKASCDGTPCPPCNIYIRIDKIIQPSPCSCF